MRDSSIEGRGLFAIDALPAGTLVLRLGGRLVDSSELAALIAAQEADPRLPYVDTITVVEDRHLVLPPGTAAHFVNHSCEPNLGQRGAYDVVARRDIDAGEELTIDYATHSGADGFDMPCDCGTPRCRGRITSDDWRIPDLQRRHAGHWTPALQARIDGATN